MCVCVLSREAMADQEAKGDEFEKKAEKKLKGWGIFGSKYDDAADLFDKAGNCYKLAKACKIPRFSFSFLTPSFRVNGRNFRTWIGDFILVISAIV